MEQNVQLNPEEREKNKNKGDKQTTITNMAGIEPTITNSHFKCQQSLKNPTLNIKTNRLKVKGWRKIQHANTNQHKVGVTMWISDRADFRARKDIRDKEEHYK